MYAEKDKRLLTSSLIIQFESDCIRGWEIQKKCWFPSTREKKIEWTWGEQFVQVGPNYVTEVFWTTKLWYGQSNTSGQVRTDQRNIWFWWAFLSAFSVHRMVIWRRTFLFQVVCFSTVNVKRVESFAQLSC